MVCDIDIILVAKVIYNVYKLFISKYELKFFLDFVNMGVSETVCPDEA